MAGDYRLIFEKGRKYQCPKCSKKTFTRYVDKVTGNQLPYNYGRCDREVNCAYFVNPYTDGYYKTILVQERSGNAKNGTKPQEVKHIKNIKQDLIPIPYEVLNQTLSSDRYKHNVFIRNLRKNVSYPFNKEDIEKVVEQYYLGTIVSRDWEGAITFPYIDINRKIRAIQVKKFDETNHTVDTSFIHALIGKHCKINKIQLPTWLQQYKNNELKVTCLFGEHLLNRYKYNPVALVEAPKSAIYGTLYFGFPDNPNSLLWLAIYNLSSINYEKCKELKGRNVFLFPDLSEDGSAYELWSRRAKELREKVWGARFTVSDLFEKNSTEEDRIKGKDIADFLINMDWREFRPKPVISQKNELTSVVNVVGAFTKDSATSNSQIYEQSKSQAGQGLTDIIPLKNVGSVESVTQKECFSTKQLIANFWRKDERKNYLATFCDSPNKIIYDSFKYSNPECNCSFSEFSIESRELIPW